MKSLSKQEFTSNSDVLCLKEGLVQKALYLNKTHHLFKNIDENITLLKEAFNIAMLSDKIVQQAQPDCLFEYMVFSSWCNAKYPYPFLEQWAACLALADVLYMNCMGIP